MKRWKVWMLRDVYPFAYVWTQKDEAYYPWIRLAGMVILSMICAAVSWYFRLSPYAAVCCCLVSAYGGYKGLWLFLYRKHVNQRRQMRDAVIIWVNSLYALIGEHNIYNAMLQSVPSAPMILQKELQQFLDVIAYDQADRDAYLDFLSQYQIDGFQEIMMKLFEYQELSKEKLRYEIAGLTKALSKIEQTRREQRFHRELFAADTLTMVMMSVPCMYMFFVSLLLSQLLME